MPAPRIAAAAVPAPWGTVHVAASSRGVVACESLTPWEPFVDGPAEVRQERSGPDEIFPGNAALLQIGLSPIYGWSEYNPHPFLAGELFENRDLARGDRKAMDGIRGGNIDDACGGLRLPGVRNLIESVNQKVKHLGVQPARVADLLFAEAGSHL